MSSSQEISQLVEAVKALSIIARRAYWHGYSHCGGEVKDDCALCHSYEVCRAEKALDTAIAMIGEV